MARRAGWGWAGAAVLAAALAGSLVDAARLRGDWRDTVLAVAAIVLAAGGAALFALVATGRAPAARAAPALVVPVALLLLHAAPLAVTLEPWRLARLGVAAGGVAAYLGWAAGLRRTLPGYATCLAALGTAAGFFAVWEPPPPKPVPIAQPLARLGPAMAARMPGWQGRHESLPPDIEKVLGADEYLNLMLESPQEPYRILVFVTYNANALTQIPHVPWVCMTQAGFRLVEIRQDGVPIPGAAGREIEPNVMLFERSDGVSVARAVMFQYFRVGDTYTSGRQVARFLATAGSRGHQGSYLSQTQVAVWLPAGETGDALAKNSRAYCLAVEFLNVLVPLLEADYYPNLRDAQGG